jgi:hypothetical protein
VLRENGNTQPNGQVIGSISEHREPAHRAEAGRWPAARKIWRLKRKRRFLPDLPRRRVPACLLNVTELELAYERWLWYQSEQFERGAQVRLAVVHSTLQEAQLLWLWADMVQGAHRKLKRHGVTGVRNARLTWVFSKQVIISVSLGTAIADLKVTKDHMRRELTLPSGPRGPKIRIWSDK